MADFSEKLRAYARAHPKNALFSLALGILFFLTLVLMFYPTDDFPAEKTTSASGTTASADGAAQSQTNGDRAAKQKQKLKLPSGKPLRDPFTLAHETEAEAKALREKRAAKADTTKNPPAEPENQPPAAPTKAHAPVHEAKQQPPAAPKLVGIAKSEDETIAVLKSGESTALAAVGETAFGYVVTEITGNAVRLAGENGEIVLRMP